MVVPPSGEVSLDLQSSKPGTQGRTGKGKIKEKAEPLFVVEEAAETEKLAEQLVQEQGLYDPTLELAGYKFPLLELLNEYDAGKAGVTQDELNQNKDRIVATLVNFKIGIQSIKATIGPTVTLYLKSCRMPASRYRGSRILKMTLRLAFQRWASALLRLSRVRERLVSRCRTRIAKW